MIKLLKKHNMLWLSDFLTQACILRNVQHIEIYLINTGLGHRLLKRVSLGE